MPAWTFQPWTAPFSPEVEWGEIISIGYPPSDSDRDSAIAVLKARATEVMPAAYRPKVRIIASKRQGATDLVPSILDVAWFYSPKRDLPPGCELWAEGCE